MPQPQPQQAGGVRCRLRTFPLLTAEEVENSPSRRDEVSAFAEVRRRRGAARHLLSAAERLKL